MSDDPFHGRDFSQKPFDAEDFAKLRHMKAELSNHWEAIHNTAVSQEGMVAFQKRLKVWGIFFAAAAAAGAYMKTQGWI